MRDPQARARSDSRELPSSLANSRCQKRLHNHRYKEALHDYLVEGDETSLLKGYELGRTALALNVGVLDLVAMHGTALGELIKDGAADGLSALSAANRFLVEVLSLFEMTQVSHRDSIIALRMMNRRRDEEATRIALSLHDEAQQLLATVYLELALLEQEESAQSVVERAQRIKTQLDQVVGQLRHISHELSPPALHQLGLVSALNYLVDGVRTRSGLSISVESDAESRARFAPTIEKALYRTVREALNNVVKHACASRVTIRIRVEDQFVTCVVKDDGIGFDLAKTKAASGGLGMLGMREHAEGLYGTLHIKSSPGAGTVLRIIIPLGEQ
jgi:signal transduction histidine kinase